MTKELEALNTIENNTMDYVRYPNGDVEQTRYNRFHAEIDLIRKTLTNLETPKTLYGIETKDLVLLAHLVNEKYARKDDFHIQLKDFKWAYQKGWDDCQKGFQEAMKISFKGFYESLEEGK